MLFLLKKSTVTVFHDPKYAFEWGFLCSRKKKFGKAQSNLNYQICVTLQAKYVRAIELVSRCNRNYAKWVLWSHTFIRIWVNLEIWFLSKKWALFEGSKLNSKRCFKNLLEKNVKSDSWQLHFFVSLHIRTVFAHFEDFECFMVIIH